MPTGYTSEIRDGISFENFVFSCARAFGACITMRDEPDKDIPKEFEPSKYHLEELEKINKKTKELDEISIDQATIRAEEDYRREIITNREGIEKNNELRRKYNQMLLKVKAWTPPTSGHQELKNFMISQIETSIEWDCSNSSYIINPPQLLSAIDWLNNEREEVIYKYNYHTIENEKEIQRVAMRNEWIKKLRESLKDEI